MGDIQLNLMVAACEGGGIGKDGLLPWKLKKEWDFFQRSTTNTLDPSKTNAVIYGRICWDKRGGPMPNRTNVVLSRTMDRSPEGAILARSLDAAIEILSKAPLRDSIETVWVTGGEEIYREAMLHPCCYRIYLSKIYAHFDCDVFFPPIDEHRFEIAVDPSAPQGIQRDGDVEWELFVWRRKPSG